jgi:hypothetical protein
VTKQRLAHSLETATLTAVAVIALLSSSAPARADDVTCTDNAATVACTSAPNYLDGLVSGDAVGVTLNSGTIAPVNQFGL